MVTTVEVSLSREYVAKIPDVSKANATIKMNGVTLDWISFHVDSTNTHAADTFEIEVPAYDQTVEDLQIVLNTESLEIEIAVDDGTGSFVRILFGYVDDYELDPVMGMVTLTGRDLTSLLMDTQAITSKVIAELTASDVAESYAEEHNLKKDITPTTQLVGQYDTFHHVLITGTTTEWDVLCKLAQNEDYDVYVINETLHFKPKTTAKDYYRIDWNYFDEAGLETSNALKIKLHRTMTIANDIEVVVKGFNSVTGTSFTKTFKRKRTPQRKQSRVKTQKYYIYANGATPDQISELARKTLDQLSAYQKRIDLSLIGDTLLTPRSIIKLTGIGYGFDQLYYPYKITRSMSFGEPFVMECSAKNHDVNTQVS